MNFLSTVCRAHLRMKQPGRTERLCRPPAAPPALGKDDAANAVLLFTIAAGESTLPKEAEESGRDAEGATQSAAHMAARTPATARRGRRDAMKDHSNSGKGEDPGLVRIRGLRGEWFA